MNQRKIAIFELIMLVVAVFALAYIIHESDPVIPLVSAAGAGCCEVTNAGAPCADVLDTSVCDTSKGSSPSLCTDTSFCEEGCCVDDVEGTYDPGVPMGSCLATGGRWEDDVNCHIPGAGLGCCILGEGTAFVTDTGCGRLSSLQGVEKDYRASLGELQCTALSTILTEGACLLGGGACEFTTQQGCSGLNGQFAEGSLCTAPDIESVCEPTELTTCIDGKDEVYFVDSCGNRANIYDISRIDDDSYWNEVISSDDSCTGELGNSESEDCGNCNRFLGGICASAGEDNFDVKKGDYYCEKTYCEFAGETSLEGERYLNGESWCVYDGNIDNGDDVVGSRHWKYVCNQGAVAVEPCADYRNQICVQSSQEINGQDFTNAACRVNNWRACFQEGASDDLSETGSLDCQNQNFTIDKFKVSLLAPRYPPGFLLGREHSNAAKSICGQATQTCVVKYEKKSSSCKCVENCGCEDLGFTQQMNDVCRKLGDCGGYVNTVGAYTDEGYTVVGAPRIGEDGYSDMNVPVPGKFALPGDFRNVLAILGATENLEEEEGEEDGGGLDAGSIGMGIQGVGYAMVVASHVATGAGWSSFASMWATSGGTTIAAGLPAADAAGGIALEAIATTTVTPGLGATFAAVANGLMTVGIVVGIAALIVGLLGEEVSTTGLIAGGIAGVAAAYATQIGINMLAGNTFAQSFTFVFSTFGGLGVLSLGIGIGVAVAVMLIFGGGIFGGDCEPVIVTYTCKPWVPPKGGDSCAECNPGGSENPIGLTPCSEYRCRSLGQACDFVNKGSDNELCVKGTVDDGAGPIMEPQLGVIGSGDDGSGGLKYSDVTANGFRLTNLQGGCVEAYTPLTFGLTTNERAICKFDISDKAFVNMTHDLGPNVPVFNHTTTFPLPDPSHGEACGFDWSGALSLYIKCQDTYGNEAPGHYIIDTCVNKGEDVSPPNFRATNPADGTLLSQGVSSEEIKVYTHEPSDCKWDAEDVAYGEMTNPMTCENDCDDLGPFGYLCSTTVPIIGGDNKFYVKCLDQPWLAGGANAGDRNPNLQSFEYDLKRVENGLAIEKIAPDEDFETNTVVTTVELKVKVVGGGERPVCTYTFEDYEDIMHTSDSVIHTYDLNLQSGNYDILVRCEDETGDFVEERAQFRMVRDTSQPQVSRIWQNGNTLNFITSEEAECKFSTKTCGFNFETGEEGGDGTEHSIKVIAGKRYYIKCKDENENIPSGCSIAVEAT
jgi:hypothetical protein